MQVFRYLPMFVLGAALGTVYFAGLWYTVRRLPDAGAPLISLLWSYLLRVSFVLAGFGLAVQGGWDQLVAALAGFFLTREILVRRLGRNIS